MQIRFFMAGAAGFEPANTGTKNQCLTTWPRPIDWLLANSRQLLASFTLNRYDSSVYVRSKQAGYIKKLQ